MVTQSKKISLYAGNYNDVRGAAITGHVIIQSAGNPCFIKESPQRLYARLLKLFEDDDIVQYDIMYKQRHAIQAAIGLILGDGHLTPFSHRTKKSMLEVKYDDKSFSYLSWLHYLLSSFGVTEIKPHKGFHQHGFRTKSHRLIGFMREVFYPNGKKIIPPNIAIYLNNPLSLAIWYMDDGSLDLRVKDHRNACIATYCFTLKECKYLQETLNMNFGIYCRIHKTTMRGKVYYRLYFPKEATQKLFALIRPFVLPCFQYKLGILSSQQPR